MYTNTQESDFPFMSPKSLRTEMRERRHRNQRNQTIFTLTAAGIIALLLLAFFLYPVLFPPAPGPTLAKGNPQAKVVVEEFADYQCPACQAYQLGMAPEIDASYVNSGQAYFIFKPFSFLGDESFQAAEAAYCASDQGKFWEYHQLLFKNQKGENVGSFTRENLLSLAEQAGLDVDTFRNCYDSQKYTRQVQADVQTAHNKGINSTPSFLVNGKKVSAGQLDAAISAALQTP